jgi:hypothetical protein
LYHNEYSYSIYFSPTNTRIQHQPRPKTDGFWTNVFPFLVDGGGYNSFQKHFHVTQNTFHTIVTQLKMHSAFVSNTSNAIPAIPV